MTRLKAPTKAYSLKESIDHVQDFYPYRRNREWNDPHYLAGRHDLDDCDLPLAQVAEALSGIANQAAGD
ncbi:hypothetical protein [Halomonas alkalisoli]|uniref:hypothetical protein n=1 Tax=Halomonas alkalisoli TaxID=2907158 RepID=UPI001F197DE6|nr:hypothetical protein [Halomonas alkalisoli]MCE9683356.1 hypothetical protein [Halomonas alkalisoli]